MIVKKVFNDETNSFEPDLTGLEDYNIISVKLNDDGKTYFVVAISKVIALIRERYSMDDELSIQRQKETKPGEFQEYFDFVEACKLQIKNS